MKRAYIFGAGASAPYGLPVLSTLTQEITSTLSKRDRSTLMKVLRECFGAATTTDIDFEQFLNRLDPRSLHYLSSTLVENSLRHRTVRMVLSQLRRFIRDKCAAAEWRSGPYDRVVRTLDQDAVLVSFNWDVLLELALERAGRPYSYLRSNTPKVTVLLKPHGSINWFALLQREGIQILPEGNLRAFGDDLKYYLCFVTAPLESPRFGASGTILEASLSSIPAIVPPVASKLLSVGGAPTDGFIEQGHTDAMKAIWATMADALCAVDEVVVIGYSMPGTDASSIETLKHFSKRRRGNKVKRLFLVDPNRGLAKYYSTILNVDAQIVCTSFDDFDPSEPLVKRTKRTSVSKNKV